jgi:hypothetical protein
MAKTVPRILRTERKIEEILAEDQCGQTSGKGTGIQLGW